MKNKTLTLVWYAYANRAITINGGKQQVIQVLILEKQNKEISYLFVIEVITNKTQVNREKIMMLQLLFKSYTTF